MFGAGIGVDNGIHSTYIEEIEVVIPTMLGRDKSFHDFNFIA